MKTEDGHKQNIIVCVKQVKTYSDDYKQHCDHTLQNPLNPFDGYALEAAARLRDADKEVCITALCLGRLGEDKALRQALSIAADHAFLAVIPNPEALDALSISHVLALAIGQLEKTLGTADLIFCGQQSTDGQSAQVGSQLAQCLGYSFIGRGLEATRNENTLQIKQKICGETQVVSVNLPCVAAFLKPAWDPRFPTVRSSILASTAVIPALQFPQPSPPALTVRGTRPVPKRNGGITIQEEDGEHSAKKLFHQLIITGVL